MRKLTKGNILAAAGIRSYLPSWGDADQGLELLRQHLPSNTNRVHVLVKASAIDKLYSTRAGNINWVTDAIVAAIQENETSPLSGVDLVDSISKVSKFFYHFFLAMRCQHMTCSFPKIVVSEPISFFQSLSKCFIEIRWYRNLFLKPF